MIALWLYLATTLVLLAALMLSVGIFVRRTARGAAAIAALGTQTDRLRVELAEDQRKRREILEKIEGILAEKRSWQELYYQSSTEHAHAQQLLLRDIESAAYQYKAVVRLVGASKSLDEAQQAARRPLRLNPVLRNLVTVFSDQHVVAGSAAVDTAVEGAHRVPGG
jgi:hypothetical protein